MHKNINTRAYWEQRFSSGDWETKRGRWQTENFAKGQIPYLQIGRNFDGTILDFGCGLGDAMPIYRENFPRAKLVGMDISQSAIEICREKYGSIASFAQGDQDSAPEVDVVIASNVFEHLSNDRTVAKHLLSKCKHLYIVVPYKEWPLYSEHVNSYDENYFSEIGQYAYTVFPCVGWSAFGMKQLWYQIYFKNIIRFFLGIPRRHRSMQIIFHLTNLTS